MKGIEDVMKRIEVILANRCPGVFWSIEELFSNISTAFPEWVNNLVATAPRIALTSVRWLPTFSGCDR